MLSSQRRNYCINFLLTTHHISQINFVLDLFIHETFLFHHSRDNNPDPRRHYLSQSHSSDHQSLRLVEESPSYWIDRLRSVFRRVLPRVEVQVDGFVDKNNECVDNRRSSSDNGYIGDNNRALCLRRHVDDRELLLSVLEANCNHPTSL